MTGKSARAPLLFAACFLVYLVSASILVPYTSDAAEMLRVSDKIRSHGFSIVPGEENTEARGFAKFGLGQSLLDLPVAGLFTDAPHAPPARRDIELLLVGALGAAITATTDVLVFLLAQALGYRPRIALAAALVCGFATGLWPDARTLIADATLAPLWLLALYALVRHRADARAHWPLIAGVAAGYAVLTKPTCVLAVAAFGLYLLYVAWTRVEADATKRKRVIATSLAAFTAPVVAIGLVVLWYDRLRYGSILHTGYDLDRDAAFGFHSPFLVGLYGLLFSAGKGLFFYSPAVLLGVIGARASLARHRAESILAICLSGAWILLHAHWWAWHGDLAWGPRFLDPILPLLVLLGLPLCERAFTSSTQLPRILVSGLVALSAWIQLPALVTAPAQLTSMIYQSRIFGADTYDAATFPIRDDGAHVHFIPEFSPLAGQRWLASCCVWEPDPKRRDDCLSHPPWQSLNAKWALPGEELRQQCFSDAWWLAPGSDSSSHALALGFLASGLTLLGLTWKNCADPLPS